MEVPTLARAEPSEPQEVSRNQRFVAGIFALLGYALFIGWFGTPFGVLSILLIFVSTTLMVLFALGGPVKMAMASSFGVTIAMTITELL